MELAGRYLVRYATGLEAYLALQLALMRCYIARGGTELEWCARMAPAFRRRYGALLGRDAARGPKGRA